MKKLFSIALVLAMLFTLSTPALATAEPEIKAVMTGNGSKAILTVSVGEFQSDALTWSNNNTVVVELGGYIVSVAIKGNKVDKVTWESAANGIDVPAGDVVADADDDSTAAVIFNDPDIGGGGKTDGEDGETGLPRVIVPANKASFHCNTNGGNGRVWIDEWTNDWNEAVAQAAAQGLKKAAVGLEFVQASEDAKRWVLVTKDYECPECGSPYWISYSNKSGLPNGKNMQLQHYMVDDDDPIWNTDFKLVKTVEGTVISDWVSDKDIDFIDLMGQIKFEAYVVNGNGAEIADNATPYATGTLGAAGGLIDFDKTFVLDQWYAITESYVAGSWAEQNFAAPTIQYFNATESGPSKGLTIDWDDQEVVAKFTAMHAIDAENYVLNEALVHEAVTIGNRPNAELRAKVSNAFGVQDAVQGMNEGDKHFTGLRFFNGATNDAGEASNGVTYYFGDKGVKYDLYNNPDTTVPDLSLIEVTWTAAWHTEAVDVYLVDAVINGEPAEEKLTYVGRVFNRKNPNGKSEDGFDFVARVVGNFTYTDIFLPDNIDSAAAVRLVDATTDVNTPVATHKEYKHWDDGYDLDALIAYYTLRPDTFENTLSSGGDLPVVVD